VRWLGLSLALLVGCASGPEKSIDKAESLIEQGRLREAIAVLEKSEEEHPSPRVYYLLGLSHCKLKDIDRVQKYFNMALSSDSSYAPDIAQAYTLLGDQYQADSQTDLAARSFELVLELSPYSDLEQRFYVMGDYYYGTERYEKAADYYQRALLSTPDNQAAPQARLHIVSAYYNLGKDVEALDLCEQYLKRGRDEDLLYQKGMIAYELALKSFDQDSLQASVFYLSKTIDAGHPVPLQDDAHFLLAEIALKLGHYEEAKANFETVLRLNPYGESQIARDARERLRAIDEREGVE